MSDGVEDLTDTKSDDPKGESVGDWDAEDAQADNTAEEEAGGKDTEGDDVMGRSLSTKYFDMALAWGYMLKCRADGWKRFCVARHLPPFPLRHRVPQLAIRGVASLTGAAD